MASSFFSTSSDDLIPPYEIVFSCCICQKTITDLYPRAASNKGLNDGSDDTERVATKLWMTECAHITCGEHLDGGGAPFHPENERPKAACPVCMTEKGDLTDRKLFGIVSHQPGEHDTAIPPNFFVTPPEGGLKDPSHVTRALKFQYLSMLRYGRAIRKRFEEAQRSLAAADKRTGELFSSVQTLKKERRTLQEKMKSLEAVEKKYKTFKDREPEIKHYLGQFARLARENTTLKDQLTTLGYEVPRTVWSMSKPPPKAGADPPSQTDGQPRDERHPVRATNATTSGQHLPSRQSTTIQHRSSSSSRKRTHDDYLEGITDGDFEVLIDAPVQRRHEPRESMLPPPLPIQRAPQRSLPVQRDQFESSSSQRYLESSTNIDVRPRVKAAEVQMYQAGAWNNAHDEEVQILQPSQSYQRPDPPLMSGAIGPAPDRRSFEVHRVDHRNAQAVPHPRFTRPAPDSRLGHGNHYSQPLPQPHSDLVQYRQKLSGPARYIQTPAARQLPSRAASRSSFVRQSLVPSASRGNIRGPDSGYFSNGGEPRQAARYVPMDENFTSAPPRQLDPMSQPAFESPFFKPHFNGPIPQQQSQMYQRSATGQSEQLVTDLQHLRVEPASPPPRLRPSLNALSFIDEPYKATNQPIYAQQRGPFSQSQEEQPYRPAIISRAGFIQDPRVQQQQQPRRQPNSIRLPSAMPSSSQPLAHTKGARSGVSMVRSIGGNSVRPSTNSYSPGGGFFPRNNGGAASSRGLFSAAGRRSVRR